MTDSELLYLSSKQFEDYILTNEILTERFWSWKYQIYNFEEIVDKIENEKLYAKHKQDTIIKSTQNQFWI